jgi:hypothetical protein
MRFRLRRHTSPTRARLDPATVELVRLGSLLQVVLRAVALQEQADAVIAGCGRPGETPYEVARRGRRVAGEYGRLSGWAADLAGTDPLSTRIGELLRFHLYLLDVALKLAFPKYRTENLERRRLELTGLGEPARALRDAEVVLRMRIAELEG